MQTSVILFISLFISINLVAQHDVLAQDARQEVVTTYLSQVGVSEATGANDGEEVERYLNAVNLSSGQPWCAAFVSYCLTAARIDNPRSGWSPSYFPATRVIYLRSSKDNKMPIRADVFGLYYSNLGRVGHVGFVHYWGNSWVLTVEGNTNKDGSREGNTVAIKRRPIKTIYAVSRWID